LVVLPKKFLYNHPILGNYVEPFSIITSYASQLVFLEIVWKVRRS
jgi:hypothetical protein